MKIFQSAAFLAALLTGQAVAQDAAKQLFRVSAPKGVFDSALEAFGDELDIWQANLVGDSVQAEIYATEAVVHQFYATEQTRDAASLVQIERDAVDMARLIDDSAAATAACTAATRRHLQEIGPDAKYTDNAFFDCWRTADEVYAFLDKLVSENAGVLSKIDSVSSTIEGRTIPAYKISTGSGKKAVYVQGLIHAREWHAGSTTFYSIAALLDGLRGNDTSLTSVVDEYDWYFVPIVNIDGYVFSHSPTGNRLWRKNRRPTVTSTGAAAFGIDLNRNFGPLEFFNRGNDSVRSDTYPGPAPLSEPETAGIYAFLQSLPLAGALDIHAFSNLVLRPFGNTFDEAPAPYGDKLRTMGDNVKAAIEVNNTYTYTSQTAAELYLCYGTFMDSIFAEFNQTASLSFEMEGTGFVQPESVIRPGGQHVFQGVVQFARELAAYYA